MIVVDTSVWIDFLKGGESSESEYLQTSLQDQQVMMVPVVLSELLSSPRMTKSVESLLIALPRLEADSEYWIRAGQLRRSIYKKGLGVALADILIAQCCLDADLPLLTTDTDFLTIAAHSALKLAVLS